MPTSLLRVEVPFRPLSLSLSNDRCVQYHVGHAVFSTRFEDRTWMVAQSLSFPSALARNWLMSFSRVAWLSESTDMRASLPISTGEATALREREVLRSDVPASFVGASRLSSTNANARLGLRGWPNRSTTTHTRRGFSYDLQCLPRRYWIVPIGRGLSLSKASRDPNKGV